MVEGNGANVAISASPQPEGVQRISDLSAVNLTPGEPLYWREKHGPPLVGMPSENDLLSVLTWAGIGAAGRRRSRRCGDQAAFAFAVPASDLAANVALVTTAMGPEGSFDARQDSPIADAPHDCAANLSKRLGYGTAKAVE